MIGGGNKLYIGGAFTIVTGVNQQRYAVFSGAPAANTPAGRRLGRDRPVLAGNERDADARRSPRTTPTANPLTSRYQWTRNGTDIAGATAAVLDMSVAGRRRQGRPDPPAGHRQRRNRELVAADLLAGHGGEHGADARRSRWTATPRARAPCSRRRRCEPTPTPTRSSFTYVWTVNGTVTPDHRRRRRSTDSLDLSVAGNGDPGDVDRRHGDAERRHGERVAASRTRPR